MKTTKEARIKGLQAMALYPSTARQNDLNKQGALKKRTIMAAKKHAWNNYIPSMDKNTTAFWRFAKQKLNTPTTPRTNTAITKPGNGPIRKRKKISCLGKLMPRKKKMRYFVSLPFFEYILFLYLGLT
jgi:hypothetical protein